MKKANTPQNKYSYFKTPIYRRNIVINFKGIFSKLIYLVVLKMFLF